MKVTDVVDLGGGHLIEFGEATWGNTDKSVRNRYPTTNGGFSPHSSSEVPIEDLEVLLVESARRDLLDPKASLRIASALLESIDRQTP